ncbi:hypothetical protein KA107_00960 [Candidatus Pacearchaeota archaeon]|nr:hypothetical protein [Candidatus Pacearchaeota archaeon]
MGLEKIGGIWISKHGRELLARIPDFIPGVWKNPAYRSTSITSNGKPVKIDFQEESYYDKIWAGDLEIARYTWMEEEILRRGLNNVRMVRTYFQEKNSLLMEFLENIYTRPGEAGEHLNEEANDSYFALLRLGIPMDFSHDDNGNLIVYDPHCQICKLS